MVMNDIYRLNYLNSYLQIVWHGERCDSGLDGRPQLGRQGVQIVSAVLFQDDVSVHSLACRKLRVISDYLDKN